MNIAIFYFSGTGNTKKVALEYQKQFRLKNKCDLFSLHLEKKIDVKSWQDKISLSYTCF